VEPITQRREEKQRALVEQLPLYSSGNHGQGLALAASLLNPSAYVIVPKPYVPIKQLAIAQHGAHVIVVEDRAASRTSSS
jgi:threonine dehydratase